MTPRIPGMEGPSPLQLDSSKFVDVMPAPGTLLVRPVVPEKTKGGVHLPSGAVTTDSTNYVVCHVVAMRSRTGLYPVDEDDIGDLDEWPCCDIGDHVIVQSSLVGAMSLVVNGHGHAIVPFDAIMGVLRPAPPDVVQ